MDLGKWFSEEHQISSPLRPEDFEETDIPQQPGEDEDEEGRK